jgi:3-hydroxybutyryl-CoA dehydratase
LAKYFDDYVIDEASTTQSRTITEADIVAFAGLSGDFNELHMSEEWAKKGPFGRRIAHGALVFSVSTGLTVQAGGYSDAIIAFYGVDHLRFVKPVFIGDTIRVKKKVIELTAKDDARGVVAFETTVVNQNEEPVIVYTDRVMVRRRK